MVSKLLLLKKSFYNFFIKKRHLQVWGITAVPFKNLNLLFTNSGMNQYVGFLNEKLTPPACFKNIVNSQVCVRLGGKLNDLSLVGLDHTHQTSFTMLGNWSISNYFKKTSTNLTFSLLNMWKIPLHRLHITIFDPLRNKFKKPPTNLLDFEVLLQVVSCLDRFRLNVCGSIHSKPKEDNFWQMGSLGPCGHSAEFFFNVTGGLRGMLELWNTVFIKFLKKKNAFGFLKNKYVDTGLGLERVLGLYNVTYGYTRYKLKYSIYRNVSFLRFIGTLSVYLQPNIKNFNYIYRLLYDHINTSLLLVRSSVSLKNKGRGFMLKKLLGRVVFYSKVLNLKYVCGKDVYMKFMLLTNKNIVGWRASLRSFNFFYYKQCGIFKKSTPALSLLSKVKTSALTKEVIYTYTTYGTSLKKIRKSLNNLNLKLNWNFFLKISIY